MKFSLGQVVATPAALQALQDAGQTAAEFLARHQRGDWGIVGPHDAAANELHVTFKGGATYVHFDVHRVFFHNMLAAKSKGQFYADHIKGVFKHRKL